VGKVKVRFAPSPTGILHIGGARTALFNYLYARHTGGVMTLRIEDTDKTRSRQEYLQNIFESLRWLGIEWDEEPVYQGKRFEIYKKYAEDLLKKGKAYEQEAEKGKAVVFKIDRKVIEWSDIIHGKIGRNLIDDPDVVMIKSDGTPTYNFACVIDDMESGITHVIRGDDHIANTPKQICIYRALGAEPPKFGHIPLILNPDGSKMSKDYKKRGKEGREIMIPTSVLAYRDTGYLSEALFNFLSLLGWSPGDDREILSKEEIISIFDIERVRSIPAKFDIDKLQWMNGHYIRKKGIEELEKAVMPYLEKSYDLSKFPTYIVREAILQQKERLRVLGEIVELTRFVFSDEVKFDQSAVEKVLKRGRVGDVLSLVKQELAGLEKFEKGQIEHALRKIAMRLGIKFQEVAQPVRVVLTGGTASPPINETIWIVGKKRVLERIERAILRFSLK
jgi:glutamyl-tRNA synthetase